MMRMLKAALLAGASVGLMATAAQAQVPMPGFYFSGQGAYFWDTGPNDHRQFPGFAAGSTGDGYKFQGVLGYRFDVPWDIGIGAGYGWLSKGKGEGPFSNKIKGEYWTIDGTIGYTFADPAAGFAWRPFIGVRYVDFSHKSQDSVAPIFTGKFDYSGIGPRVGADAAYRFADTGWFIGGTVAGAVTFGDSKASGNFFASSKDKSRMAYNLDAQLGIGYEFSPGFAVQAGYMIDYWWDVNYKVASTTSGKGDRYAHGPFVRLAWNYGLPPQLAAYAPVPPPSPGAPVQKYIVFFDWDRSNITPQAADTIRQAADAYRAGRNARIEATGHADRSGSDQYNMGLSLRRANAVKAELVRSGVPAANIVVLGRGETQPLVQTADGVREPQNRRVEIVLQ
jgi:outer membrane protein OmpA-like peptidoglycan-associated protein